MHVMFLILDGSLHFGHNFIDGSKNRLTDLFELLSLHVVAKILILHQTLDVDLVLPVAGQDLPLFLYVLHHLQHCLFVLGQVAT